MPLVQARLRAEPTPGLSEAVVAALTRLTSEVLGKEHERTSVVVDYVSEARWARGGKMPVRGFLVEVKITLGTNSREEKASYVREVNRALQGLLDGAAGYVVVDEIAADAWGYAGETQEARYSKARTVA